MTYFMSWRFVIILYVVALSNLIVEENIELFCKISSIEENIIIYFPHTLRCRHSPEKYFRRHENNKKIKRSTVQHKINYKYFKNSFHIM